MAPRLPLNPFKHIILFGLPLFSLSAILILLTNQATAQQLAVDHWGAILIITFWSLVNSSVLTLILFSLRYIAHNSAIKYQLNSRGLTLNQKLIPYSRIRTHTFPEAKSTRHHNEPLLYTYLKTPGRRLLLTFLNQNMYAKAAAAFAHYQATANK